MLPILDTPTYFLTIPSTNDKIKFRPFLVKEEKILMLALQTDDNDTVFNAIKEIIGNCTFGQLELTKLSTFDIEFLFLQIRSKSKGNICELVFTCKHNTSEEEYKPCNQENQAKIDLDTVKVTFTEGHSKKIMLTSNVGIQMKYPNILQAYDLLKDNDPQKIYDNLFMFVDTVFKGDEVLETTKEEFSAWIETLTKSQFQKIKDFFITMPKVEIKIPIKCTKCKCEEVVAVEGLQSFLE